jgi:hypothetical protein
MTAEEKKEMKDLIIAGWSYGEVARKFKISRQRVHQLTNNTKASNPLRKEVIERDNYRCQMCGKPYNVTKPQDNQVHHINGISGDNRMENMILLCRECHMIIHCLFNEKTAKEYKDKYLCLLREKDLESNIVINSKTLAFEEDNQPVDN